MSSPERRAFSISFLHDHVEGAAREKSGHRIAVFGVGVTAMMLFSTGDIPSEHQGVGDHAVAVAEGNHVDVEELLVVAVAGGLPVAQLLPRNTPVDIRAELRPEDAATHDLGNWPVDELPTVGSHEGSDAVVYELESMIRSYQENVIAGEVNDALECIAHAPC